MVSSITKKTIIVMHKGGAQIRGSEVCIGQTIIALLNEQYHVVVIRNNSVLDSRLPKSERLTLIDGMFPELMIDGPTVSLPIFEYPKALLRLYKLIRKFNPSLILCNGGLPCQTAVPVGRLMGVNVICHFHHPAPKRYFYFWLVKYTKHLIFPSNFTSSLVKQKCGRTGTVVYNAVDLYKRYKPADQVDSSHRNQLNIKPNSLVFGQIGALVPHKRPDLVIKCFAELLKERPDSHLVIIGVGSMLSELKALIKDIGLNSKVSLLGYVDSILPYLQHVIDISILASIEEGLGISVIEAAGCEVPSITRDCTGLSEVVIHEETGLKFDANDDTGLLRCMQEMANNPKLRTKYGKAARLYALEKFDLATYKQQMLDTIKNNET